MEPILKSPEFDIFFKGANVIDTKWIDAQTSLRPFIAGMLSYYPWWIVLLYRLRELLVNLLGLVKHEIPDHPPEFSAAEISFTPGDHVSFFIVRQAREACFWVAETPEDKHLTAYFGVVAQNLSDGTTRLHVFTTVRYLHWSGPIYFNLIRPFHHLVVLAMMKAGASHKAREESSMRVMNHTDATLIDRFSIKERIAMRLGWYGFMAVGTYGIYEQAPAWSAGYLLFSILAFALVILPGLCAHCPYPSQYNTCLFLPPALLNRFYPYKGQQLHPVAKIGVFAAMAGVVVMPLFWLIADLPVLMLFLLLGLPTVAAFPRHYCKRCRHHGCPMNKA